MQASPSLSADTLSPDDLDAQFRRPLMSFFLRRVSSRAEAEDLTQQVFLRLLKARPQDEVRDIQAYVFRVAANLLSNRYRDRARRPEVSLPGEEMADLAQSGYVEILTPESVLLSKDSLVEVLRSLDELGERTKHMFILFRLENMRQQQIADLFGCSRSTVEKQVMKATLHLARAHGRV